MNASKSESCLEGWLCTHTPLETAQLNSCWAVTRVDIWPYASVAGAAPQLVHPPVQKAGCEIIRKQPSWRWGFLVARAVLSLLFVESKPQNLSICLPGAQVKMHSRLKWINWNTKLWQTKTGKYISQRIEFTGMLIT